MDAVVNGNSWNGGYMGQFSSPPQPSPTVLSFCMLLSIYVKLLEEMMSYHRLKGSEFKDKTFHDIPSVHATSNCTIVQPELSRPRWHQPLPEQQLARAQPRKDPRQWKKRGDSKNLSLQGEFSLRLQNPYHLGSSANSRALLDVGIAGSKIHIYFHLSPAKSLHPTLSCIKWAIVSHTVGAFRYRLSKSIIYKRCTAWRVLLSSNTSHHGHIHPAFWPLPWIQISAEGLVLDSQKLLKGLTQLFMTFPLALQPWLATRHCSQDNRANSLAHDVKNLPDLMQTRTTMGLKTRTIKGNIIFTRKDETHFHAGITW